MEKIKQHKKELEQKLMYSNDIDFCEYAEIQYRLDEIKKIIEKKLKSTL